MKLISYLLLLLSAVMGISAVDVQKSFLVYFNNDASDSAISQASMSPRTGRPPSACCCPPQDRHSLPTRSRDMTLK